MWRYWRTQLDFWTLFQGRTLQASSTHHWIVVCHRCLFYMLLLPPPHCQNSSRYMSPRRYLCMDWRRGLHHLPRTYRSDILQSKRVLVNKTTHKKQLINEMLNKRLENKQNWHSGQESLTASLSISNPWPVKPRTTDLETVNSAPKPKWSRNGSSYLWRPVGLIMEAFVNQGVMTVRNEDPQKSTAEQLWYFLFWLCCSYMHLSQKQAVW